MRGSPGGGGQHGQSRGDKDLYVGEILPASEAIRGSRTSGKEFSYRFAVGERGLRNGTREVAFTG